MTLKSDLAKGSRALHRHRPAILKIADRAARRFSVKIYRFAICGNHLHFLIRGKRREGLQNFFRVFAGHIAQTILTAVPLTNDEKARRLCAQHGCAKNRRLFWSVLLYSRVVSWGREYFVVAAYILRNQLEAFSRIAYRPRQKTKPPADQGWRLSVRF